MNGKKKLVQINTVCNTSTGRIMGAIQREAVSRGYEAVSYVGRRKPFADMACVKFGNPLSFWLHVALTTFLDRQGYGSFLPTRKLIRELRKENPDIIHLHNLHGYYLNLPVLFRYLTEEFKGEVFWTFHDCWPFTGHCAFYDYTGCAGWKAGCAGCREYKKTYPYALFRNRTEANFRRKQAAFTGVPNLTVVVPSNWLKAEAEQSFLKDYPVRVIPNGIDTGTFSPVSSGLRLKLGLSEKFVILGVANVWERRKGLGYLLDLSKWLVDSCQVVLIGLSKKQLRRLPKQVLGLERTSSVSELAAYYSMADVFVNATLEDNFPTTNLEALACGTPVITFDTGGSPESLTDACGRGVPKGDKEALFRAVLQEMEKPKSKEACRMRAEQYKKEDRFLEYRNLYHRLADRGE